MFKWLKNEGIKAGTFNWRLLSTQKKRRRMKNISLGGTRWPSSVFSIRFAPCQTILVSTSFMTPVRRQQNVVEEENLRTFFLYFFYYYFYAYTVAQYAFLRNWFWINIKTSIYYVVLTSELFELSVRFYVVCYILRQPI